MKRMLLFLGLFLGMSLAQSTYPLNWVSHEFIDIGGDNTRGVAYNATTDHVLVATRKGGVRIIILDAATGDSLGMMNTEGLSGGTYPINLIDVAEDGTIYVCNLSAPQFTPGATFKIYRYADESAAPETIFDDALDDKRYGDSFAVRTFGSDKLLYSSGFETVDVVVIRDTGGATATLDSQPVLPVPGNARHGISPLANGNLWINSANPEHPPTLLSSGGTLISSVPDSFASPGGTSHVKALKLGQYKLLTVSNAYAATVRTVRYFEDELGTVTYDYFGENSDSSALFYSSGLNSNPNATAVVDYDSRRHSLITLMGFNSIGSLSMDNLLKASAPRDSNLVVSIDGINDYFPTDHVGTSNGRDMFFTWSVGKVFFGLSGDGLVDPTEERFLYIAFDLDPEGPNGTQTPPVARGGINALPFKADIVYEVEPWDEADFLLGTIWKWNGSSWEENLFDGNVAAQGALAFADEGEDKVTEVSAIRNDAGVGALTGEVAVMAYMASNGQGVEASFPDKNPLGANAKFTHYYYVDQLGEGYFPTDTNYVNVVRSTLTAIGDKPIEQPRRFTLEQNYPNPFNPTTEITYSLPRKADVRIEIFDIAGRQVAKVDQGNKNSGTHSVTFNAGSLTSGVYFYRLVANDRIISTRKMVLIK